ERAELASTLLMVGGGGAVYWLIAGIVYWRRRNQAAPSPPLAPRVSQEQPEYYIAIHGQTTGPFTAAQVRAARREMPATALIWGPRFSEWLPISQSFPG
ncbi:MAG TPA: GYF domain-containing protein, partial [Prosthecobacter sp.]|nr:GYF domain-containing protein [Prosthecobacter sp.]